MIDGLGDYFAGVVATMVGLALAAGAAIVGLVWLCVWWFTPTPEPTPQPYQPLRFTETEKTYLGDLAVCSAVILLKEQSLPKDERGFDAEGLKALSDASQWAWENSMDLVPVEPSK